MSATIHNVVWAVRHHTLPFSTHIYYICVRKVCGNSRCKDIDFFTNRNKIVPKYLLGGTYFVVFVPFDKTKDGIVVAFFERLIDFSTVCSEVGTGHDVVDAEIHAAAVVA